MAGNQQDCQAIPRYLSPSLAGLSKCKNIAMLSHHLKPIRRFSSIFIHKSTMQVWAARSKVFYLGLSTLLSSSQNVGMVKSMQQLHAQCTSLSYQSSGEYITEIQCLNVQNLGISINLENRCFDHSAAICFCHHNLHGMPDRRRSAPRGEAGQCV